MGPITRRQQIGCFRRRIAALILRLELQDAAGHVGQAGHRADGGVANPGLPAGHGGLCCAETRGQFGLGQVQLLTFSYAVQPTALLSDFGVSSARRRRGFWYPGEVPGEPLSIPQPGCLLSALGGLDGRSCLSEPRLSTRISKTLWIKA